MYLKTSVIYCGGKNKAIFENIVKRMPNDFLFFQNFDNIKKIEQSNIVLVKDIDADSEFEKIEEQTSLFNIQIGKIFILSDSQFLPDSFAYDADFLLEPFDYKQAAHALFRAKTLISHKKEIQRLKIQLSEKGQELSELTQIGIALSAERDSDTLLELILTKAREITSADAGSLYLVEKDPLKKVDEENFWADKQLRFKLAHNDTISASYAEFVMPIEKKSMAGYTALSGKPLNIQDAYHLPEKSEFQHNRSFDQKMGYQTHSVLCIPMKSHQGETIGVLQLINRKNDFSMPINMDTLLQQVIPFDERCVELASSLASQAAVSIENMRLYEEIKNLFEGFIVASVHAIEQRDPTTSGHSERVARLTVDLAQTVDKISEGPYEHIKFSRDDIQQIKYASLLHDFGKIGVREHVLVKAKKLYPEQLTTIQFRFKFIKKAIECNYSNKKIKTLLEKNRQSALSAMGNIDHSFAEKLKEIDSYIQFILEANEPRILAEGGYDKLLEICNFTFQDDGSTEHYLTEDERYMLSIPKGSLSEEERKEIESHVTHTYNFLSRIPWASHLKSVPQIAFAHHEKLDGSGYPRRLISKEIPLPSKMMTIADIFDALTARDRPYKKAVPNDRALTILGYEVKEGKIDSELYRIFLEAEIYKDQEG